MSEMVERAKVSIKVGTGEWGKLRDVSVDASILGPFAVHKTPGFAGWTVTHVPTGRSVCLFLDRPESGLVLAGKLGELGGWGFTEAEMVKSSPPAWLSNVKRTIKWVRRDDKLNRFAPPKYAKASEALGGGDE